MRLILPALYHALHQVVSGGRRAGTNITTPNSDEMKEQCRGGGIADAGP